MTKEMLEFEVSYAKTIILKWSISNNIWIRQKTDSTAVHSREKMQASCNKSVNITISACGCSKAASWIINSFEVIYTRALANALCHLPSWKLNSTTKKLSIELQTSNVWYLLTFLFCFFQPLQLLILVLFHQRLAPHTGMVSSVPWAWLDISTFGESRCTRPTLTLIYLVYNMPSNVWNT